MCGGVSGKCRGGGVSGVVWCGTALSGGMYGEVSGDWCSCGVSGVAVG